MQVFGESFGVRDLSVSYRGNQTLKRDSEKFGVEFSDREVAKNLRGVEAGFPFSGAQLTERSRT